MSSNATILVTILDINDNAPRFVTPLADTEFRIPENAGMGDRVTNVEFRAIDDDDNNNVTYRVVGGTGQGIFDVEPTEGHIFLASGHSLDREVIGFYNLTVQASDDGNMTTDITGTIRVVDVNDNVPEFDANLYPAFVAESTNDSSVLIRVSAFDLDTDNHTIGYGFVPLVGCDSSMTYTTFITEREVNKGSQLMLGVAFLWSFSANIDKVGVQNSSTIFWAIANYTQVKPRRFLWLLTSIFLLLSTLNLVLPYGCIWQEVTGLQSINLPWAIPSTKKNQKMYS